MQCFRHVTQARVFKTLQMQQNEGLDIWHPSSYNSLALRKIIVHQRHAIHNVAYIAWHWCAIIFLSDNDL